MLCHRILYCHRAYSTAARGRGAGGGARRDGGPMRLKTCFWKLRHCASAACGTPDPRVDRMTFRSRAPTPRGAAYL
eukprot:scaffold118101_cov60-Phaeocystis_antarctica.AAC.2